MNIFTAIKAFYLLVYYIFLSNRPFKGYFASVVIAHLVSFMTIFLFIFILFFGKNNKKRFHYEALFSHGLSYEEWRPADEIKSRMDKIQIISKGESHISLDTYYSFLLFLSFSGLADFRIETPEERADHFLGKVTKEGDNFILHLKGLKLNVNNDSESALKIEALRQQYIASVNEEIYCGKTLSRLVYNGARIVFKRKHIGTKHPEKIDKIVNLFGIVTN